jgi:hypothetical protein
MNPDPSDTVHPIAVPPAADQREHEFRAAAAGARAAAAWLGWHATWRQLSALVLSDGTPCGPLNPDELECLLLDDGRGVSLGDLAGDGDEGMARSAAFARGFVSAAFGMIQGKPGQA